MHIPMELVAVRLPSPRSRNDVEAALGFTMTKGIEATYYAKIDHALVMYTQFNVLTVFNWKQDDMVNLLQTLGVDDAAEFREHLLYQDYPVVLDSELPAGFAVDNEKITLKQYDMLSLLIVAHVVSQSVALERYEQILNDYYQRSRRLIDSADTNSIFMRTRLARFAKSLVLIRHDMLIDLYLLDKPNILWDNEAAEMLYNKLASVLELKDRFDVVEYKLNNIKDDIMMVMDLTNHNHSSFLEWIIIVLIGVEIMMGLVEWFGPSFTH